MGDVCGKKNKKSLRVWLRAGIFYLKSFFSFSPRETEKEIYYNFLLDVFTEEVFSNLYIS